MTESHTLSLTGDSKLIIHYLDDKGVLMSRKGPFKKYNDLGRLSKIQSLEKKNFDNKNTLGSKYTPSCMKNLKKETEMGIWEVKSKPLMKN